MITYASGKDADVVIWVVKHAREEHKAAVEWLNNHTDDKIGFFLCEIKLFQIGDSDIAPSFTVVERPNDWTKEIKKTKTSAGTRKLPITQDVANMFRAIIEDREAPKYEKIIDGYSGFLFVDKNGNPLVSMHWQHRLNHMVKRYNDIYRVQMPNITPHVCRHTYCSNMAKSGMNPKTLQYLMGHSDIAVTLNVYTHIGLDDATEELRKLEEMENARRELEKGQEKPVSQKMFKAI